MAGYSDEEEYTGPHRPAAAPFDTVSLGPGPHRVPQFDTANLGPGPYRVGQFDTMNLGAPVRVQEPPNSQPTPGEGRNAAFYTEAPPASAGGYTGGSGQTPMNPALDTRSGEKGGRMDPGLVIASLALRAAAVVSLIIAMAVLASDSQTVDGSTVSFSDLSSAKYALAAAIVGVVYSIYETVSVAVHLATGRLLLPGHISLFVSYIGDQVVIVLLLTGASAAAATFKDLHDLPVISSYGAYFCDVMGNFCKQGAGAVAVMFLGFCFLAASLVISSYCFYKRKS